LIFENADRFIFVSILGAMINFVLKLILAAVPTLIGYLIITKYKPISQSIYSVTMSTIVEYIEIINLLGVFHYFIYHRIAVYVELLNSDRFNTSMLFS
jgi:hypothetical protein